VILKLKDGGEIAYPLSQLCPSDQAYVAAAPNTVEPPRPATCKPNFESIWPERVSYSEDPEVTVVEENAETKTFHYESANYRYICDVRLSKVVVKDFAVMFEATHLYCQMLPLGLNGDTNHKAKHQIFLYEEFENYIRAGGLPDSAGIFISRRGLVLVPLTSLGVKPVGKTYMLDRKRNNVPLTHELVHQLSPEAYFQPGARGWFSEGLAEYVAITPYRAGSFNVRTNLRDLPEYVTGYGTKEKGGRALGKTIRLPALRTFMLQSYDDFLKSDQLNYGAGLLLVIYFSHLDGAGDGARLKAFLKSLQAGKVGDEALESLLGGRSFEVLQAEITKAWKGQGVELLFSK
jgi:hypothetical protein